MKGEKILEILESLVLLPIGVGHFIEGFLEAGYGASFSKLNYEIENAGSNNDFKETKDKRIKQRFYNILGYLIKDGLVVKEKKGDNWFFRITKKGKEKLLFLKKKEKNKLPNFNYSEYKKSDNRAVILIFDIPEKEKRKRSWLRGAIKSIGFKLLQKSVWLGKGKVPEQFISDLKDIKIVEYVDIFEISKAGSLHRII
jgi:DNA-binding PadR family transcriptional regulator